MKRIFTPHPEYTHAVGGLSYLDLRNPIREYALGPGGSIIRRANTPFSCRKRSRAKQVV